MKKSYSTSERKGLPGGPNEVFTYTTGVFSTQGYRKDSPDVDNPFNIINSNLISMDDVEFPVRGVDDLGNEQLMMPGFNYKFPGSKVFEVPEKDHSKFHKHGHAFMDNNEVGYEGGFTSENLDFHGKYSTPLQYLAKQNDLHLALTAKIKRGQNEFSITPDIGFHHGNPNFGVNIGFKRTFQPGGETWGPGDIDMLNFYYNYLDSDKYKERLKSSGYPNPQEIADKRQGSHFNTRIHYKDETPGMWNSFMDLLSGDLTNMGGSAYIPGDKMGPITQGDILIYEGQALLEDTTPGDIERHERAHAMVQDGELNEYDQRQFSERETESSRNKGYRHGKKIPIGNQQLEESYADMTGLRYTIFDELGIDATKDITDEDMSKIQALIKDSKYKSAKRLFDAYSPEDIKWMLNNIASNQSVSSDQMQMAQNGDEIINTSGPRAKEAPVDEAAMNAMMKARLAYEYERGNPAAKRMVAPVDNPYQFDNGYTGTHYMGSYDNYAVPNIQEVNGKLELTGPIANEEMRFDRPEDAAYFSENYKKIAPMFVENEKQRLMKEFMSNYNPQQMYQPGGETAVSASDIIDDDESGEKIISNRPNDSYEYKRSKDPVTGVMSYYQRKKGSGTWKDAGEEGSTGYRAITNVFGDDKTGYATSTERAEFVVGEKQKRKMEDTEYIQGLLEKANHPLDLVYGNEELGIPAFGSEIKNMEQYADDFYDPYGDEEDRYIQYAKPGATEEEIDAAVKREQENFLSNRGQTQEEYDESERLRMEREDKAAAEERARKEKDRMESGHDGFGGNLVQEWERTGETHDEYMDRISGEYEQQNADDRLEFLQDVPGLSTYMNIADLVGVTDAVNLGVDLADNGLSALTDGNNALTIAGIVPGIGLLGKAGKIAKYAGKGLKYTDKAKDVYKNTINPINRVLNKIGDAKSSSKILNKYNAGSLSDINKHYLKSNFISSGNAAMQKNIDDVFDVTKKFGLSNDAWGAATAYGMYESRDAVDRIIHGEGSTDDFVKAGLNFIPGANIAKGTGLVTYGTKAGVKGIDKIFYGDEDANKTDRQISNDNSKVNALEFKVGGLVSLKPKIYAQEGVETKDSKDPFVGDFMYTVDDIEYMNENPDQFCAEGTCLAQAFDVYDKRIGNRYSSELFPSEQRLKENLGISSAKKADWDSPGYKLNNDGQVVFGPKGVEERPLTDAEQSWIDRNPYFLAEGRQREGNSDGDYPDDLDMTADSWDIHGIMTEKGGTNLFTGDEGDFTKLDLDARSNIIKSMPIGTIIGFGTNRKRKGYNESKGLSSSYHSAVVVGYTEEGDPVVYDYGEYTVITGDKYSTNTHSYDLSRLTNITFPKDQEGKGKGFLEEKGLFNNTPEKLNLNEEALQTELYDKGDADMLKPFHDTLVSKKVQLMNDLDINEEDYNMISSLLLAQTMQESSGGKSFEDSYVPQFISEWQGDTQGLTQLNINNILDDEALAPIAKKYGITEEADLFDPVKSAIASMIYGKRNLQAAKKNYKDGSKSGVRTYKPRSDIRETFGMNVNITYNGEEFKTDEGVVVPFENAVGWDYDLDEIQAKFDEVKEGKYRVYEKDGEILVDKITNGNKEDLSVEEMFAYNWQSPTALRTGDAQGNSEYAKNVLRVYNKLKQKTEDLAEERLGGEITPEYVQRMQEALNKEVQKLNGSTSTLSERSKILNSIVGTYNENVPEQFKLGGGVMSKPFKLYKNYVNGKVKTKEAVKNYDKLNRVYYGEAKANRLSPSNYIMSYIIGR